MHNLFTNATTTLSSNSPSYSQSPSSSQLPSSSQAFSPTPKRKGTTAASLIDGEQTDEDDDDREISKTLFSFN